MKYPIAYAFLVGFVLIAQWGFLILSGSVPEFDSEPWAIGHHITAELLMALTLMVGAWAARRARPWAATVLLLGFGMLIYSAVNSSGYYSQQGQWGFVFLFAVILVTVARAARQLLPKPGKLRHRARKA